MKPGKRSIILVSLALMVLRLPVGAQEIPFMAEYVARNGTLNRLCSEPHRGVSLPALESLKEKGEEAFRDAHIHEVIRALSEAISLLRGKPWDGTAQFVASLTLEANRLVIEPGQDLQVSLIRMFPVEESCI